MTREFSSRRYGDAVSMVLPQRGDRMIHRPVLPALLFLFAPVLLSPPPATIVTASTAAAADRAVTELYVQDLSIEHLSGNSG